MITLYAISTGLALFALCQFVATAPDMTRFERFGTCGVFIVSYAALWLTV